MLPGQLYSRQRLYWRQNTSQDAPVLREGCQKERERNDNQANQNEAYLLPKSCGISSVCVRSNK